MFRPKILIKLLTAVVFSMNAYAIGPEFNTSEKGGLEKVRLSLWYNGVESDHKRVELALGEHKQEGHQDIAYPEELIRPLQKSIDL